MFVKLVLISLVLVVIIMLALGVKLLFDKNARFEAHSCALDGGSADADGGCDKCQLKDLANCPEIR